jgi:GxxExxY protein
VVFARDVFVGEPQKRKGREGTQKKKMDENELSNQILGAAIEVHEALGPGLLESVYESALRAELHARGIESRRQIELPLFYKGQRLDGALRVDLLVSDLVIVEVKSVEQFAEIHRAQLLTYLRLANKRLGLLINFNATTLRNSVRRVVNHL